MIRVISTAPAEHVNYMRVIQKVMDTRRDQGLQPLTNVGLAMLQAAYRAQA